MHDLNYWKNAIEEVMNILRTGKSEYKVLADIRT